MSNRLAEELNPYLLQHAKNPVDWYPWGNHAIDKARQENKPILLSIGYSTCHWCHVMAHEAFSDLETAKVMNENFINIKVDREERPDLDKIYQHAFQMLNRSGGGWPLNVFLDPETLLPFFAGTYFPLNARYQLPAFKDLLLQLTKFYTEKQAQIKNQSSQLLNWLAPKFDLVTDSKMDLTVWSQAITKIRNEFDEVNGGFGSAPKFFHPGYFSLLFFEENNHDIISKTLTKQAYGGIYDQIGGGFFRYSVDAKWEIPHFEKMLYDNAQLLLIYTQAYLHDPQPLYKKIITETANWVIREMQSEHGGYFAAIDADSEGKEGLYYLWTPTQVQQALSAEEYDIAKNLFNLTQPPNFEGLWHLHATSAEIEKTNLNLIQEKLLTIRKKRIAPSKDQKILTAWNALMIKAMLFAGMHLQQNEWIESAEKALNFIYSTMYRDDTLFAAAINKQTTTKAFLDDYAFLIDALLLQLQYKWDPKYFKFTQILADQLIKNFYHTENSGFFFVSENTEALIYRPKSFTDDVIPSGNGIACLVLQHLGYLLSEQKYLEIVEKTLQAAWSSLQAFPIGYPSMLRALKEFLNPPKIIIIRGEKSNVNEWQNALPYSQQYFSYAISNTESELPPAIAEKKLTKTGAFICEGMKCLEPVDNLEKLVNYLEKCRVDHVC